MNNINESIVNSSSELKGKHEVFKYCGYVYITEVERGKIKIGMSTNTSKRVRNIETQSGYEIQRAWVSPECYNYRNLEKEMHNILSDYRIIGEYFSFDFDKAVSICEKLAFDRFDKDRDNLLDTSIESTFEMLKSITLYDFNGKRKEYQTKKDAAIESIKNEFCLLHDRILFLERRVEELETECDHFSIVCYMRYIKNNEIDELIEDELGGKMTRYCKEHEVEMGSVPDPRFGTVRTYPKWSLDAVLN